MSNVKLAVRVRPFFERELKSEKDRVAVINVVDDHTVTITNIKVNASGAGDSRERVRSYNADYALDSSCASRDPRYVSQDKVFETIGRDVLATLTGGRSACVLAYGQSATGKTHTMMGSGSQPGLVPRLCRALAEDDGMPVTISFLEIYNERVHDLLVCEEPPLPPPPPSAACHSLPRRRGNARKDLRVREHPERGTFVQNLRRVVVHSSEALLALVREGSARRRTASTRRNPTSSRSHALIELTTLRATLHLADLAGSEKASWEGCGGGRQKEGANINKSLVALSNVISALVSSRSVVGGGGGGVRFVPYRDSALTWLLKDCFSGGARAFIIATVSPSAACYGESASTLRWAARARQLPEPRAPRTPLTTRAALHAQLDRLLAELAAHYIRYIPETGKIIYDDNHWNLHLDTVVTKSGNVDEFESKMDPQSAKTDNQNSESTTSSVASGSSDIINVLDKKQPSNLSNIIGKEIDKLFGPSLERTTSGIDLKPPLKIKRRQYRSQEVLPNDKPLYSPSGIDTAEPVSLNVTEPVVSELSKNVPPVSILYDNTQRAEIIASVTERLYSKLKKKEESAVAKMESMVDKKITEPLSELRICTNARQRLVDLSHKALRNKRKIGIPAHSQTRKIVTRVRNQGIDVQKDLQPYYIKERDSYTLHQDVGTETMQLTPRCKEIAVGPKCGSVAYSDTSTTTGAIVKYKNSFVMTDDLIKNDRCTQTIMIPFPAPRRKRPIFANYLRSGVRRKSLLERAASPVININISQAYQAESESQSDDGTHTISSMASSSVFKPIVATTTPDLLNNHSAIDAKNCNIESQTIAKIPTKNVIEEKELINSMNKSEYYGTPNHSMINSQNNIDDVFAEGDCSLPRVKLNSLTINNVKEMENLILNRNMNTYPYNIVLSPSRENGNEKRSVSFKELNALKSPPTLSAKNERHETTVRNAFSSELSSSDKDVHCKSDTLNQPSSCDSTDSTEGDTDAFVWKRGPVVQQKQTSMKLPETFHFSPIYKHNVTRYRHSRAKMYREFLGLDTEINTPVKDIECDVYNVSEIEEANKNYNLKLQYFEKKRDKSDNFDRYEKNILNSCDKLESTVNKYEKYLNGCSLKNNNRNYQEQLQTPREYLQHLVRIRRQIVNDDSDNVYTSTDSSQNYK